MEGDNRQLKKSSIYFGWFLRPQSGGRASRFDFEGTRTCNLSLQRLLCSYWCLRGLRVETGVGSDLNMEANSGGDFRYGGEFRG
jgi:hypothetical protein